MDCIGLRARNEAGGALFALGIRRAEAGTAGAAADPAEARRL